MKLGYIFSFSVILILIVTFTVVNFGQIQCKKRNLYSLLVRSSLFGHLNYPPLGLSVAFSLKKFK